VSNAGADDSSFDHQRQSVIENLHFDKRNRTASREGRYDLTERKSMLWTIFVILLVLWLLGLVSSYTLGGFIHILLVIAIVVLIIQLISGRRRL
jgi:Family of unknown function (DUF5670)